MAVGRLGYDGFAAMQAAFCEAAARRGEISSICNLTLAGRDVPISVVGDVLAGIVADAFAHLIRPATTRDNERKPSIALWDRSAAGVPAPQRPSTDVWKSEGPGWRLDAYDDFRFTREERPESLVWFDRATGRLIAMFEDARRFLLYEKARPLSRRIPEICRHLGAQDIHAAAVAWGGHGALIVGGTGRGKTSTSLDCLAEGLQFLGDDSVAITEDDNGFNVHSLYASARVHPQQTARWKRFAPFWIAPGPRDDKAMLMPMMVPGTSVVIGAAARAIIVPKIGEGRVTVKQVSRGEGFHALVRDSAENRRFSLSRDQFQRFVRLTQSLPAYSVQVGEDPAAVAGAIGKVIADCSA